MTTSTVILTAYNPSFFALESLTFSSSNISLIQTFREKVFTGCLQWTVTSIKETWQGLKALIAFPAGDVLDNWLFSPWTQSCSLPVLQDVISSQPLSPLSFCVVLKKAIFVVMHSRELMKHRLSPEHCGFFKHLCWTTSSVLFYLKDVLCSNHLFTSPYLWEEIETGRDKDMSCTIYTRCIIKLLLIVTW